MGQIVALDSMVFIYYFETDPRYIKFVDQLFSQIESGESQATTSIISLIETLSPSKYIEDTITRNKIEYFFRHALNLSVIPIEWEIATESARLRRENHTLKTPDSIQLATALTHHADAFITNDNRLKGLSFPKLKILSLSASK